MVHRIRNDQHKQAAMGRRQFAAEVHRQRAGQRAAGDAAGITRSGSLAANGIAPSEIKHRPRIIAALPASRSVWANLRRARKVAIPIPIGGTIPAAMVAAIGAPLDAASKPTENAYAALLIGPPRSTHIMPPSRMPSSTALVVPIVLRKSVRPVSNRATGGPTR